MRRGVIHLMRSWGDGESRCGPVGAWSEAVLSPDLAACKRCLRSWNAEQDRKLAQKLYRIDDAAVAGFGLADAIAMQPEGRRHECGSGAQQHLQARADKHRPMTPSILKQANRP